jgi:hypothetical protein
MSDFFSKADKSDIKACAAGVQGARDKAIAAYRASLRVHGIRLGDPYFNFMSEIDNPCPDLSLRARYRIDVLKRNGD